MTATRPSLCAARRGRPPATIGALTALWASTALAGPPELDPDGRLDTSQAAVAVGFDGPPDGALPVRVFGPAGALDPAAVGALVRVDPEPLEGTGALELGGDAEVATFGLSRLQPEFEGQRVRIAFWQRAQGARLVGFLGWWTDPVAVSDRLDPSGSHRLAMLRMLPSGRRTSDGWVEYTTGPVDFMLGGRLAPALILQTELDDLHGVSNPDPEARVLLDGFTIDVLGAAAVPDASCSLVTERETCGALGACTLSRCADHAAVHGPVFERVEDRRAYVERRIFEVWTFAGHQGVRAGFDAFEATLRALPDRSEAEFWRGMSRAWLDLGDGHGAPPAVAYSPPPKIGLCFTQGQADLVPGAPDTPLVFDKSPFHTEVGEIELGDALVRIDGQPVDAWRDLARTWLGYNGDPDNAAYVESLQLARVVALAGAELEFARCAGPEACDSATVETRTLDVGAMMAPLWAGEAPAWRGAGPLCDGRFSRISDATSALNSVFATSREDRGATVLMINAVPGTFQAGWQAWLRAIDRALAPAPERVVLDQRIGNGGGFETLMHLVGYLDTGAHGADHFLMPWLFDLEGRADVLGTLKACAEGYDASLAFLWCGGARYELAPSEHPGLGAAGQARLAILNGRDVSGNDFLAHLLTARAGPTRSFGPGPTFGAFGMIMSLPEHGVGISGGSLQATDGAVLTGPEVPLDARLSGPGVWPDEVVLQKQSDAVRGVDTLMEVAHAWLQR